MEISEFIKTRKPFPIITSEEKESLEWEESQFFNAWIKKYPESKHDEIIERLKYILCVLYVNYSFIQSRRENDRKHKTERQRERGAHIPT